MLIIGLETRTTDKPVWTSAATPSAHKNCLCQARFTFS